jgi:hypothetical protein
MGKADRHTTPREHTGSLYRLARLLALLAILLNQPLTAIHAATDEAHLFHGASQTAHIAHASREDADHDHDGHSHPDSFHHLTCQVCPLVGSGLLPLGSATIACGSSWHHVAGAAVIQASKTEKPLRAADRVRAPPRIHLT